MKRRLGDTLSELMEGILVSTNESIPISVTSLRLDLPLEVRLSLEDGQWELVADVPGWRWQTGLEPLRARLRVSWESGGEGDERHG